MRRCLLLLPLALLAGCLAVFPPHAREKAAPPPQVGSKVVVDKREPVYLVAGDGTSCVVSRKRFEQTRIGDDVLCAWN